MKNKEIMKAIKAAEVELKKSGWFNRGKISMDECDAFLRLDGKKAVEILETVGITEDILVRGGFISAAIIFGRVL